jgi:hypothetical protein
MKNENFDPRKHSWICCPTPEDPELRELLHTYMKEIGIEEEDDGADPSYNRHTAGFIIKGKMRLCFYSAWDEPEVWK